METGIVHANTSPASDANWHKRPSFWEYYGRVIKHVWKDAAPNLWAAVLNIASLAASVVLLALHKVNPSSQSVTRIFDGSLWILGIAMLTTFVHALRAPWKIHNSTIDTIEAAQAQLLATMKAAHDETRNDHAETKRALDAIRADLMIEIERNQSADFSGSCFCECLVDTSISNPYNLRGTPGHGEQIVSSYLAVSTYLVNGKPPTVTLRTWALDIETVDGRTFRPLEQLHDHKWHIARDSVESQGFELRQVERTEELNPPLTQSIEFTHNRGATVWSVWLLVGEACDMFKATAVFKFSITDSKGVVHSFTRSPGSWPTNGRLISWQ